MKRVIFIVATVLAASAAHAELSVATMSLTGTTKKISKFEPADTFKADGLLVRTVDGNNECLLSAKVLRGNNSTGVEFIKYLKELNSSSEQFLLSCYTENGIVTQAVITEAK